MNRLIIIFALLPFLAFGYTVDEIRSRVRGAYIYFWDSNWSWKSRNFGGHFDDVLVAFKTCTIGLECSSSYLTYPDIDDVNYLSTNSFTSSNVTRPVYDLSDKYYRVSTFAELPPIFKFAQALFANGYDGAGFVSVNRSSGSAKINFNYSLAVADIASSTNLVFQSLLLQHLQSIASSVSTINQNISLVSSDLSSLASQYSSVNTNYLDPQSVLDRSAVPLDTIIPNPSDAQELQTILSTNNLRASEIASALNALSSDRLTRLAEAWSRTSSIRHDTSYPYYQKSFGEVATDPVLSASLLNEFEGQTFQQKSLDYFEVEVNNTSNAVSTLDAIHTNDLPKQFSVAASNLAQVADIARNFGLVQTTYNNGDQAIKVVVENSDPIIISAGVAIEELIARLIEINEGNSLTVGNIHGVLQSILLDCDSIFDHVRHTDVVLGDVFSQGAPGYQAFDFILTNKWTSLLEQNYEEFVDSDRSNYSYWLDRAETDYPDYVSALRDYGFGGNNWWQDNASMTFLNNALWHDLLSKADSSSLSDAFTFITNSLPDSDELVNSVSNVTSRFAESDFYFESITNSIAELTNSVASLDSLYRNTSLPSSFTLFKLNDDVEFTVETDNLATAFDLLRSGISLVYSVVAVLLLPKFLVIIIKMFMKIFARFLAISKP